MVNELAVWLILQPINDFIILVTDQLIDNRLENYVEVLRKQIFLMLSRKSNSMRMVKEHIAEIP